MPVLILLLLVLLLAYIFKCVRIVPLGQVFVTEYRGSYSRILGYGLHFLSSSERVVNKIRVTPEVIEIPLSPVITKDNVTVKLQLSVYYFVDNAEAYTYGDSNPLERLRYLSLAKLRDIVGTLSMEDTVYDNGSIAIRTQAALEDAVVAIGIRITNIEVKQVVVSSELSKALKENTGICLD